MLLDGILILFFSIEELLQLTQQLNSKDESLFLEIIFHEYTPEKMQEKLGMKPKEKEEKLFEKNFFLIFFV